MINSFIFRKNIGEVKYDICRNKIGFFSVILTQNDIRIMGYDNTGNQKMCVLINNFEGYWYSQDPFYTSSTLLIKKSAYEYIHIGCTVYEFRIHDPIIGYVSPVNDIMHHPILLANNYAYMLGDTGYLKMKRGKLTLKHPIELYDQFYSSNYEKENIVVKKVMVQYRL
uniref:Uncharacterized protein n=1 Tax=viral metagenome TaxID=1070528 RepID=A0A6C0CBU3_9ZZZZ